MIIKINSGKTSLSESWQILWLAENSCLPVLDTETPHVLMLFSQVHVGSAQWTLYGAVSLCQPR